MLTRILALSLTVSMLVCPIWCGFGLSCAAGQNGMAQAARTCCAHCAQPDPLNEPADEGKSDDSSCQGVCGGAVMTKTESPCRDRSLTLDVPLSDPIHAADRDCGTDPQRAPAADVCRLTGRELCQLKMALLR